MINIKKEAVCHKVPISNRFTMARMVGHCAFDHLVVVLGFYKLQTLTNPYMIVIALIISVFSLFNSRAKIISLEHNPEG